MSGFEDFDFLGGSRLCLRTQGVPFARTLNEYSTFVESVIRHSTTDPDSGFDTAIQECIKNGVLAEYLQRKSKEVRNMFFGEYSYEDDIRVQRREAREEGVTQGEHRKALETARNLCRSHKLSLAEIAEFTGLSLAEIEQL